VALEQTWRWFGPNDEVTLEEIKQTGATGIVTSLHQIPVGEPWPTEEIEKRKQIIEAHGFNWSVVESIPVHEDIKKRSGNYRIYIENYKQSLCNISKSGIDTVCYNFMPVLDWSRTDLNVKFYDCSITTKFESKVFAAFDLFILKRSDAEKDYSKQQINDAQNYFNTLNESQKEALIETILLGFPGSLEAYTFDKFKIAVSEYKEINGAQLKENLFEFIKEVVPVAEEAGIRMAIHPDDPPWSLLGLPRIVGNKMDIEQILFAHSSLSNGLTLCSGSLGASIKNDIADIANSFSERVHFIHLRNLTRNENGDFMEAHHLNGDLDMYSIMKVLILEQKRRIETGRKDSRMPFRPDHGHLTISDFHKKKLYPGYSLVGRMRGLAELRGLESGIRNSLSQEIH
jgi:mannonate dehydratase